ncbi:hypothetical protein OEG84_16915 [Hoeflea sp. G2-23]|uniref:Uncharacterized protein n=1 Tax=Hoeflea algicola TaxID=2983763 RepID=A0ABT3ZDG8_9HYPH|nr:hypothetical protein [Hoeflea algicola]MCY0149344.1 hypothetical protein [Hoeflea algicola]
MQQHSQTTHCGYGAGHPWYYLLDGAVLTPKQIKEKVRRSGYKGYLGEEIAAADRKPEPQRSQTLRSLRARAVDELKRDISGYRRRALDLHRYRTANPLPERPTCCADIHTNISLKHNHLVNDFAHLITIDALLSVQADLFGL